MNSEFEQKLLELKRELETQRLQQVGTMKSVLERQHSKDIVELDDVHHQEMGGLRDGKKIIPCNLCRFDRISGLPLRKPSTNVEIM